MPANFSLSYLAFGSGNLSTEAYREIVKDFPKYAMFTGQFRFSGKILDIKLGKKRSLLLSYLTKSDVRMLRKYLLKTAEILFASGARKILIPTTGTNEVESYAHAERIINRINRLSISISTVHIMSSMPIRRMKSDVLNAKGQLKADSRIYVMDASILPSSIGESPQGTIMAYVRFLIRHQKEIRTS
jgi:choline dehydrogenase-like flavoprotein